MPSRYIQNEVELDQNINEAFARLTPFEPSKNRANLYALIAQLEKTAVNGVVDATPDTIHRALVAAHRAGMIQWKKGKAPASLPDVMPGPQRRSHAAEQTVEEDTSEQATTMIQSQEQVLANIKAAMESLKPYEMVDSASNRYATLAQLERFADANGVIDASVRNVKAAIVAAHRSGEIQWKEGKAPAKPRETMSGPQRRSHTAEPEVRPKSMEEVAIEGLRAEQQNYVLTEALAKIANYSIHPHSLCLKRKQTLKTAFAADLKLFEGKKLSAEQVFDRVVSKINGFESR